MSIGKCGRCGAFAAPIEIQDNRRTVGKSFGCGTCIAQTFHELDEHRVTFEALKSYGACRASANRLMMLLTAQDDRSGAIKPDDVGPWLRLVMWRLE